MSKHVTSPSNCRWKRLEEKPGMVIVEVGLMSGFQADSILLQQVYTNYHLMSPYNVLYIVVIVFVVISVISKDRARSDAI